VFKSRIPDAEVTVVLKLNQGTNRQTGCNRLSAPFFGTFLGEAKKYKYHVAEGQAFLKLLS
jgi:hypothetical protein